jgi:uncharacterized protein YdeI (YjbR/CyaY-like superfamily)
VKLGELFVEDRSVWREWLAANHGTSCGTWLIFYRKGCGRQSLTYDESVREALCFGWIDSIIRKLDGDRYARKFTPRRQGSGWSESNRRRVEELTARGLMTPAGQRLVDSAKRDGTWLGSGPPEVPEVVPVELEKALHGNPEARAFFESLAPSYRKRFMLWVAMAKSPGTRRKRVLESVALLERGEKLGLR